jgi:polysaccharide pyruvyl transferase WcaK-like protein
MFVEIRETGFINKGAELMLRAIVSKVKENLPDVKLVMAAKPNGAPFLKRAELGLYQKIWLQRYRIQWGYMGFLIPERLRKMYGLVLNSQINVVIDASGFSYGDQWGHWNSQVAAKAVKKWKKQRTKVIFMPQAFGPFKGRKIRKFFKVLVDNADLMYARDKISYNYVNELVGQRDNVKIAPDFTCIIDGELPIGFDNEKNRFCIIPNFQMIEKTSGIESKSYIPFLVTCVNYLHEKKANPFLLIHEGDKDLRLSQQIVKESGKDIKIVREENALRIKGIIGASDGVISSRFHGLVSSLSQGVPAIATGWSHKYKMLFEDYSYPEGMISTNSSIKDIHRKINSIISNVEKQKIKEKLLKSAIVQKRASSEMWKEIFNLIN